MYVILNVVGFAKLAEAVFTGLPNILISSTTLFVSNTGDMNADIFTKGTNHAQFIKLRQMAEVKPITEQFACEFNSFEIALLLAALFSRIA